jgi:two-component SAPR family response regulator
LRVATLDGKRILVVEDEMLIAAMLEDMLADLGAIVVGPAPTIAQGLLLARNEPLDAAVLDVNVRDQRIDPVADVLAGRGIPMVFATGYGQNAAVAVRGAPILDKPYTRERVETALLRCLTSKSPGGG